MALNIINNQDDEEAKKKAQGQASPAPQGPQSAESAFGGTPSGGGPQQGQQATTGAARRGGTGFTNLSRIVGANKDNKLGSAVSGGIQRTVGDVKQGLGQAKQGFQQQAEANRLDTDANKAAREAVLNRYKYEAGADASGPSEEEINKFNQFQQGQYAGPRALENEEQLIAKSKTAEGLGQAAGSQEGRLNLLNRFVANKGYTGGQKRLDNLLLGQSAGSALKQARRESLGLGSKASTEAEVARQKAQGLEGAAKAFGEETQSQIGSAAQTYSQKLAERAKAAQEAYGQQYSDLQKQLQSGEISQELADKLGLKEGDYTWDAKDLSSLAQFNTAGPSQQFNRANVASQQEAARINALKSLSGGRLSGESDVLAQEFADPSKAGTAAQANVLSEVGANAKAVQDFLKQSEAGIKSGGQWQGAERRLGESSAALKGLDRYEKAEAATQNLYQTQGLPLKQKILALTGGNFDFDRGQLNDSALQAIQEAKMRLQWMGPGNEDYERTKNIANLENEVGAYNQAFSPLRQEHKAAEAEAAMGGGSAFWQTHDPNAARQFEAQKQQEAQNQINALRGKQIKIKKGPSGLPSLQEILSRR